MLHEALMTLGKRLIGIAAIGMLAACGSQAAPASSVYENPTNGPLPVMASIDELTKAVVADCPWRTLTPSEAGNSHEGDVTSFCERDYVAASITGDKTTTPDTVESLQGWHTSTPAICTVWNFVDIMYLFWRRKGVAPATWNGSQAPNKPAAVVQGGNWNVLAPTLESASRIASATHGYVVTESDCHLTTATGGQVAQ